MNNPKISVIIPIYNVEDYLEETLDNMLNQTFIDNMEILMIDDGSTDNSRYIVEKYALDYDNFYAFHKENGGQCVARNFALFFARGEYIHFMDSDDFITHDAYEKLYNFAKNGNYDVVTFNYLRFDHEKTWKVASQLNVFDELSGNIENTSVFDFKELCWDMTNCNKIVKKDLLDKHNIRYYYRNIIYEDNLFWIEVYINAKRMAVLKDYIYFWRYRLNLTSTTQNREIDLGKRLYEMVFIVNNFITQNIADKEVLNMKYEKLLTINLYFFITSIGSYSKEYQSVLFDDVYEMFDLVPKEYFDSLNSYYTVLYKMVENRDWDSLLQYVSFNFKSNPSVPKFLKQEYVNFIDFSNDSHFERLDSTAFDIFLEENELIIKFKNFVPFNSMDNVDETSFKLLNNKFEDVILDYSYIDGNNLHIPLSLINNGKNKIITSYYFDNIKKESYMKTKVNSSFYFDDFDIYIKRGTAEHLILIKREKEDVDAIIKNVKLLDGKLHFEGFSSKKLDNIIINDCLDLAKFKYPISYTSENNFSFDVDYVDFLKAPITKWELYSDSKFNSFNLINEFEFHDEKHWIFIKNQDNKIFVEFKLFNLMNKIGELNQENTKLKLYNNKLIFINNKLNNLLSTQDYNNSLWYDVDNSKSISDYTTFNGKNGKLSIIDDYKQLEVIINDPTVVRVFSASFTGDLLVDVEVKVTDYANIGLSSSNDVLKFSFIRISNRDWLFYRFVRINNEITSYVSSDGINWKDINLTSNNLDNDECQFQFTCGYSNELDKRMMIRNIKVFKL